MVNPFPVVAVTLSTPVIADVVPVASPNVNRVLPRYIVEFASCVLLMPPVLTSTSPITPTLNVLVLKLATPTSVVVA